MARLDEVIVSIDEEKVKVEIVLLNMRQLNGSPECCWYALHF